MNRRGGNPTSLISTYADYCVIAFVVEGDVLGAFSRIFDAAMMLHANVVVDVCYAFFDKIQTKLFHL